MILAFDNHNSKTLTKNLVYIFYIRQLKKLAFFILVYEITF